MSIASGLLSVTQAMVLTFRLSFRNCKTCHYQILSAGEEIHEAIHPLSTSSRAVLSSDCSQVVRLVLSSYLVVVLRLFEEHAALNLLLFVPELLSHPLCHVGLKELLHVLGALAVDRRQVDVRAGGPHRTNFPSHLEIFLIVMALKTVLLLELHLHQKFLFLRKRLSVR